MSEKTKKLTMLAMLAAISYLMVALIHIPIFPAAPFLTYEPKDVVIVIGGFLFGPAASALLAVVVATIELVTFSATGFWGWLMNILSTVSFACVASLVYKKKHTAKGAMLGLVCGVFTVTAVMVLWNYFITPIYMGYPREAVAAMLLPVFLPFNLIKATLNMAWTLLIYKPVVTGLRKAGILPQSRGVSVAEASAGRRFKPGIMLVGALILVSCVLLILAIRGII